MKFFAVGLICLMTFSTAALAEVYPSIISVKGDVQLQKEIIQVENKVPVHQERSIRLTTKTKMKDKARIAASAGSEALFVLKSGAKLILGENSVVEFPSIHWKNGVIGEIRLIKGQIHYVCEKDCDLKIQTDLSETVLPVGDFVVRYDPSIPQAEMVVVTGEVVFRGLENENSLTLRAGEKATFIGVFTEDQKIGYDVLLKGRKVAQGKLSQVEKVSESEIVKFKKEFESKKKTDKQMKQAREAADRKNMQICRSPNAQLNECAWICEKNKKSAKACEYEKGAHCLRQRCNANGEWSDQIILPISQAKCSATIIIAPCDY